MTPIAVNKGVALVLALLLFALPAQAQDSTESGYTVRGFDQRIQDGIDLVYNMRFAAAEAHFEEIVSAEPANPVGYFFLAMVAWWRVLSDLDNTAHDQAFYDRIEACLVVCDRRLREAPMDFDAVLFKGGAIGFRGRLRGNRGHYLKAARDGLRCLPLLNKSRRMEPTNRDILFGQGIYNYFAEVIPREKPVTRPLMFLLPDGNRELGLSQLDEVAENGRYARAEAAYFLAQIFTLFEGDRETARSYLQYLYDRYPRNALFHLRLARASTELGHRRYGERLYQDWLTRSLGGQAGYHIHGRLEALFYLGKSALNGRRLDAAVRHFAAVDSLGGQLQRQRDQRHVSLANLMLGMTHDLLGQRDLARTRYRRVTALPDWQDSHARARRYLKSPYIHGR
jgi:hypothetical protein